MKSTCAFFMNMAAVAGAMVMPAGDQPLAGRWKEVFNSDSAHYGGSNVGNAGAVEALQGNGYELNLTIPPLAAIFLVPES